MVLSGNRYDGTCVPKKFTRPAGVAWAPVGRVVAAPALVMGTTCEVVKPCVETWTRMWKSRGSGSPSVPPPAPVPLVHCWWVPALGMPQPSSEWTPGRSPKASWWPASGPGSTTPAPNCTDLRTVQAFGSPGAASVPLGYRHPGLIALGMGSGSLYGWTMKGLVAIGSPSTPQPVNERSLIGIGCWSTQACAHACFVTMPAAPDNAPALSTSRLVKFVRAICLLPRGGVKARPHSFGRGHVQWSCHAEVRGFPRMR